MSGKKKSEKGLELIDFNCPAEVRYWTNKLSCTKEELVNAIEALGNSAQAINDALLSRPKKKSFPSDSIDPLHLRCKSFLGWSFFKTSRSGRTAHSANAS